MRLLGSVLLVAFLVAGCSSTVAGPTFRLSGTFTEGFSQDDRADFIATVRPYSDDYRFMESFPEQFAIDGIEGGCEQLRLDLQGKDYVASVGTCVAET